MSFDLKTMALPRFRPRATIGALVCVWMIAVALGFVVIVRYGFAAGPVGEAPSRHVVQDVPESADRHTLVVAAHPHCPCTRATMSEIDRLAPLVSDAMSIRVLLFLPDEAPDEWADGAIRAAAKRIPNTTIELDRAGRVAKTFGALTSGSVLLLSPRGEVQFRGGLTVARGHEGASLGRRAILDWIRTGDGASKAPVFGCALFDAAAASTNGDSR